jgi:hypothetical protein
MNKDGEYFRHGQAHTRNPRKATIYSKEGKTKAAVAQLNIHYPGQLWHALPLPDAIWLWEKLIALLTRNG